MHYQCQRDLFAIRCLSNVEMDPENLLAFNQTSSGRSYQILLTES